jgi:hypothetical protein
LQFLSVFGYNRSRLGLAFINAPFSESERVMSNCRGGGWPAATLSLAFALLAGCNSDTLQDLKNKVGQGVDKVKEAGQGAAEKVGAAAPSYLSLEMGGAVDAKSCYASLTKLPGARPAVLQLTSYEDPKNEQFPSVFIWAEVPSHQPDSLAGQKFKAQVYVQKEANGPVWKSEIAEPIELTIAKSGGQELAGEISAGKVTSSDGGASIELRGKFGGAMR